MDIGTPGAQGTVKYKDLGLPGAPDTVKYEGSGPPGAPDTVKYEVLRPRAHQCVCVYMCFWAPGACQPLKNGFFGPRGVSAIKKWLVWSPGRFSH